MRRHCLRLARGDTEPDDLASMTFFEVWRFRHRAHFERRSVNSPVDACVATNVAAIANRATRRYRRVLDRPPAAAAAVAAEDAIADVVDKSDRLALAQAGLDRPG